MRFFIIIYFLFIYYTNSVAQQTDTLVYTLEDLFEIAIKNNKDLRIALSDVEASQLEYQIALQQFKPQLYVSGTLPRLTRAIETITDDEGIDRFVNRSSMTNSLGLDLAYRLESTGGLLYLRSDIERLDVFKIGTQPGFNNYFFTPINVGYSHPLFEFNDLKWQKRRLDLVNKELKSQFALKREEILFTTAQKYANCYESRLQAEITEKKITDADSLYTIKSRLFEIGKATKAEMLRLELEREQNRVQLADQRRLWELYRRDLADHIGLDIPRPWRVGSPQPLQQLTIPVDVAISHSTQNGWIIAVNNRRLAEAQADIERARSNRDITLDVQASLGLNRSAPELSQLFRNFEDRELVSITFRAPLTGWKQYAWKEELSRERFYQEQLMQEQDSQSIARNVTDLVTGFELARQTLQIKENAVATAADIYDLSLQQYLLGNLTFTELSIVQNEKYQALLEYNRALLQLVTSYYEIRKTTLYDFENNKPLQLEQG